MRDNFGEFIALHARELMARETDELDRYGAEAFFEVSGAEEWIRRNRFPATGPVDIEAAAGQLGVEVEWAYLRTASALTEGIIDDKPLRIVINHDSENHRFSFGHEVGHMYLEFVAGIRHTKLRRPKIEDFCDIFGSVFAILPQEIEAVTHADEGLLLEYAEKFDLPIEETVYRFVRAGLLPERMVVESIAGWGTRKGEPYRDLICLPCRKDFGSCAGMDEPDTVLRFPDKPFGGFFAICDSNESEHRQAHQRNNGGSL